ncbi:DUF1054 domain-containing protein [Gracilibacillus oryzae]|uniref:UPF0637 protein F9U64_03075 n=1 Tax=Gracilibacillus oryzae TaxID=1672701 RepID=A0A7C8KRX3_9BACI|nr:DUF1054 domain-containing protein [Gracilibacillus oryzae]KAB8138612.1 DUF1054 domain-containing protein [Gracilibacillus oryzae]
MTFNGFNKEDFETFYIEGLDERMNAIKERIQPKFQTIHDLVIEDLQIIAGHEMHLHIAKHARRTVNPPKDTWSAYCHNKRGYKKHPHFQIGLWHDQLFIWLAYIYELPHKAEIADKFINELDEIKVTIPQDYYVSLDHMKNEAHPVSDIDIAKSLERFKKVKKAEFLIGKRFDANNPIVHDGDALIKEIKDTFQTVSPLYISSMKV